LSFDLLTLKLQVRVIVRGIRNLTNFDVSGISLSSFYTYGPSWPTHHTHVRRTTRHRKFATLIFDLAGDGPYHGDIGLRLFVLRCTPSLKFVGLSVWKI